VVVGFQRSHPRRFDDDVGLKARPRFRRFLAADSPVEDVDHPAAATLPQYKLKPVRKSHDLDLSILRQPLAVEDEPIAATLVFRCRLGMRIFGALQMNFASVV
jgi:hypothetical protein